MTLRPRTQTKRHCALLHATLRYAFPLLCVAGCTIDVPVGPLQRVEHAEPRKVIIRSVDGLFGGRLKPDELLISQTAIPPHVPEAAQRFCLKSGRFESPKASETYVVVLVNGDVIHHQIATEEHQCELLQYTPLTG